MAEVLAMTISSLLHSLGADMPEADVAAWALENDADTRGLELVRSLLDEARRERNERLAGTLRTKSRIPQDSPKTFDNFSMERLSEEDRRRLLSLRSLSFIPAGRGIVIVGGEWTGKTHLVQAIGNECCDHGYRTLYLTAAELKTKVRKAAAKGTADRLLNTLSNYTCLIIDALDKEVFDPLQSHFFYSLVDRRVTSCRPGSIVLASTRDLNMLADRFEDKSLYASTMDRVLSFFTCIVLQGRRYSGMKTDIVPLKLI